MRRTGTVVAAGALAVALATGGCSGTASRGGSGDDRIVAPSEYVEDIETPGTVGGVMDEADAAEAQAEAAEEAQKKAAETQKKKRPSGGG